MNQYDRMRQIKVASAISMHIHNIDFTTTWGKTFI